MSYMGMKSYDSSDFEKLDYIFKTMVPAADEIWLFGDGRYGKAFEKFFSMCGVKICGKVVSDEKHLGYDQKEKIIVLEQFKQRYIPDRVKLLLTIDSCFYTEVVPKLLFMHDDLIYISRAWKENVLARCGDINGLTVLVPVCDYCAGIKCFGCTVAAPLAKKSSYDFERYRQDLLYVKKIVANDVTHINFTGGDIFLHPRFVEFVEYARGLFPNAYLDCSTNGLLLSKQTDDVWKKLGEYLISFNWTLYPIDYFEVENIVERISNISNGGVKISIIGDALDEDKHSWLIPYTFTRQEKYDWLFCRFHKDSHQCMTMRDGRVAYCFSMRRLHWLLENFGDKLPNDFKKAAQTTSIDLYSIHSADQLYEWMNTRMDFCDYCAIRKRKSMGKWLPSKCEMSEWII